MRHGFKQASDIHNSVVLGQFFWHNEFFPVTQRSRGPTVPGAVTVARKSIFFLSVKLANIGSFLNDDDVIPTKAHVGRNDVVVDVSGGLRHRPRLFLLPGSVLDL